MVKDEFMDCFDRMILIWRQDKTIELYEELANEYFRSLSFYDIDILHNAISMAKDDGLTTYGKLPEVGQLTPYLNVCKANNAIDNTIFDQSFDNYNPILAKLNRIFWKLLTSLMCAKFSGKLVEYSDRIKIINQFCLIIREYKSLEKINHCPDTNLIIESIIGINKSIGNEVLRQI